MKNKTLFWNFLSGLLYGANTFIFLLIIATFKNDIDKNTFSFILSLSSFIYLLASMEMRAFQVANKEYSFSSYLSIRFLSSTITLLISTIIIYIIYQNNAYLMIFLLFILLKVIEAMTEVIEGNMHQHNDLLGASKSLFIRTFLTLFVFTIIIWLRQNLFLATSTIVILNIIYCLLLYIWAIKKEQIKLNFHDCYNIFPILKKLIPLTIGSCLWFSLFFFPKIRLEFIDNNLQYILNCLIIPCSFFNLISSFCFKNTLLIFRDTVNDQKLFIKKVKHYLILLFLICVPLTIISYYLGIPLLSYLFKVSIKKYNMAFLILIISGELNLISNFCYYMLVILKKPRTILLGYLLSFIILVTLLILSNSLVSICLSILIAMLCNLLFFIYHIFKNS